MCSSLSPSFSLPLFLFLSLFLSPSLPQSQIYMMEQSKRSMELQVSRVQLQNSMLERRNTELQQLYRNEKEKRRRIRDKLKLYKVRGRRRRRRRRREEMNVYLYNEMNDVFLSVKLFSNSNKMRKHFYVYSTVHMFTCPCVSCVYIMFKV